MQLGRKGKPGTLLEALKSEVAGLEEAVASQTQVMPEAAVPQSASEAARQQFIPQEATERYGLCLLTISGTAS